MIKKLLPGILVCAMIAAFSWFLGGVFPIAGAPVVSILTGIICAGVFAKQINHNIKLGDGIKYTSKKLLQYSIILLGFGMNLFNVAEAGRQAVFIILLAFTTALAAAFIIGKLLKLPGNTVTLTGIGTAICGGSAIAAIAPIIRAKDEDIAQSVSTIFLFNVIAVFIFPFIGRLMGMSDIAFGMWAGTAINDTSSVVAAGTSWSAAAGNDTALQFATVVKLTRTLLIIPAALVLSIYTSRRQKHEKYEKAGGFHYIKAFPWFVIFFIIAAVINTFAPIPADLTGMFVSAGKFGIVMAMAGIGLNTNLRSLPANGFKPILLGLCCWAAIAAASIGAQNIFIN